jgi:hypothetical protein
MPKKAESYTDVMEDFEKKIMPGILHWNHPNFFAYFGAGNAYPSVLGDMLSSGIAAIGFSWVSLKCSEVFCVLFDQVFDRRRVPLCKNSNQSCSIGTQKPWTCLSFS